MAIFDKNHNNNTYILYLLQSVFNEIMMCLIVQRRNNNYACSFCIILKLLTILVNLFKSCDAMFLFEVVVFKSFKGIKKCSYGFLSSYLRKNIVKHIFIKHRKW